MNKAIEITEQDIQKDLNKEISKLNNGITTTNEFFLNIVDIHRRYVTNVLGAK